MEPELLLCVPGPWKDASAFLRQVITLEPKGRYMFANSILADTAGKDHIPLDLTPADPNIARAFEIAGQGKIPQLTLARIQGHSSVVYLHFPLDIGIVQFRRSRIATTRDRRGAAMRLSIPTARRIGPTGGPRRWLLGVWTAPTTLIGFVVATMIGCGKAEHIGGPAARAWLFRVPAARLKGWRAIAIGNVIIVHETILERHGAWLLAHELSHTRQHDWLGPAYLPAHAVSQLVSILIYWVRPLTQYAPTHAYNPLERRFLCVPIDAIVHPPPAGEPSDSILRAFGLLK